MILRIDLEQTHANAHFRVYAIAARSAFESCMESNQLAGLSFLESGELIAVVDSKPEEASEHRFSATQLNFFSERISHLHSVADILPLRFANPVTLRELSALMLERQEFYKANLLHISGCTEVNARWAITDDCMIAHTADAGQPTSRRGSNYLRSKHRASQQDRACERELEVLAVEAGASTGIHFVDMRTSLRRLKDIGRDYAPNDQPSTPTSRQPVLIVGVEVLIRRELASEYLHSLGGVRYRNALPIVASGPWPPYSFINDVPSAITSAPLQASTFPGQVQKCAIFPSDEAAC